MARINAYHVAYLEELLDVDIDTFFVNADTARWVDMKLAPGEVKEWDYTGTVKFRVTRRGKAALPKYADEPEPEDMFKLSLPSRLRMWLGGLAVDVPRARQTVISNFFSYKKKATDPQTGEEGS